MEKKQFKKHFGSKFRPKKENLEEKNPLAAKLKEKLKSTTLNKNQKSERASIDCVKTLKLTTKMKSSNNPNESSNSKQSSKSNGATQETLKTNSKSSDSTVGKTKQNTKKNKKMFTFQVKNESNQTNQTNKKKWKNVNKKMKQKKPLASKESPLESQHISKENKRKNEIKTNKNGGPKRFKTVNGFVETNAHDEEETKLVQETLKKAKKKRSQAKKDQNGVCKGENTETGPAIKVHSVDVNQINGSGSNSDSEADSYINKFFGDDDDNFDENRIYSLDEIEANKRNGFLSKDSGDVTKSDESSSSEDSSNNNSADDLSDLSSILISNSDKSNENSPNNKLVGYKRGAKTTDNDSDDFSWTDVIDESQQSLSDISEMFFGTDSSVSLGSEVDSDDLDDTYECESTSTDVELMDEYEDDRSYDEHDEYSCDSDDNSYSNDDSDIESSQDTYDDFLNRRQYNDDHSSNSDHEYTDSGYDDLRVAQGTAITYSISDDRIKIFENDTESRIVELPVTDSDNESCVELIPISMTRAKYMRIERQNIMAKQAKLEKEKADKELKRLAYEKSIADYYKMNNLAEKSTIQTDEPMNGPISIIKCTKSFNHSDLDWMVDNDSAKQSDDDIDTTFPKSKAKQVVVISIPKDRKSKTNSKKKQENAVKIHQYVPVTKEYEKTSAKKLHENMEEEEDETDESMDGSEYASEDELTSEIASTSKSPNGNEPQFFNSVNSRHVLLLLRKKLHFHGSLRVKLIAGSAIAFGYELQPNKTITLYSPRGHGLISLTPNTNDSSAMQHLQTLDKLKVDFYSQDIDHVKLEFKHDSDAILLLERDQTNKGVNMIDRYMRETVFPNINAFNNESPFYSSEFVLHCKFITEPDNGLVSNEEWSSIKLKNKSKLLTIGGKGVGKSTFVRYLINSNLKKFHKFVFIDLDIGQPELFVPQTLSAAIVTEPILGPGYLQNLKPAKAVLFGDINVLPDPIRYLRCVGEIFEFCSSHNEFVNIPWVINTMGYSRGFGSELMACILKIFKPTDLVQIQSRKFSDNFDQIMDADVVNNFKFNVFENEMKQIDGICKHETHVFETARDRKNQKNNDMNAKDLRYAIILAKLGNCLKYNSDWLTSVKPFEASLNDLDVLVMNGEEVNPSDYLDLLNGNLVYLCEKPTNNTTDIVDCHGIGIVRSVDVQTNKLYLISTISLAELSHVNVLAICAIPLPSAVFLNQHIQIRGAVPFVYNSNNFVGSKQVAHHIFRSERRSNNKPIQLMED